MTSLAELMLLATLVSADPAAGDENVEAVSALSALRPAVVVAPLTVVELAERDVDFPFQGEYLGSAAAPCPCTMGLQIVALGEGKFEAMLHEHGLPGAGGSGIAAYRLKGERATSSNLELVGGGWKAAVLDGQTAAIGTLDGSPFITLSRTQRTSPTMGLQPPAQAVILFDGTEPDQLINAQLTEDGLLKVGAETKAGYRDFTMHAEFRTPWQPLKRGQGRGNSGFYLQRRYEVQVLDSFGQWPQANEAASIYKTRPPRINMSYPPLVWQTYDIDFTAARFDQLGNKTANAVLTLRHNGVTVHDHLSLFHKTGAGKLEGPEALPILFQNHGDAVNYRNIWLVEN